MQGSRCWPAMFHSRIAASDVDGMMRHFGPGDDTVVYAQVLPDEHRGLGEIREHFSAQLAGVNSVEAKIVDLRILTNGLLGGVHARVNFAITREDGSVERFSKRHANLLRRVGDGWYSMVENVPSPVDLRTGVPQTDPVD